MKVYILSSFPQWWFLKTRKIGSSLQSSYSLRVTLLSLPVTSASIFTSVALLWMVIWSALSALIMIITVFQHSWTHWTVFMRSYSLTLKLQWKIVRGRSKPCICKLSFYKFLTLILWGYRKSFNKTNLTWLLSSTALWLSLMMIMTVLRMTILKHCHNFWTRCLLMHDNLSHPLLKLLQCPCAVLEVLLWFPSWFRDIVFFSLDKIVSCLTNDLLA